MSLADTGMQAAPTSYLLANLHIITETRMVMTGTTVFQYTSDEPEPVLTDLCNINTLRTGLLNCLNARSRGLIQSEVRFL